MKLTSSHPVHPGRGTARTPARIRVSGALRAALILVVFSVHVVFTGSAHASPPLTPVAGGIPAVTPDAELIVSFDDLASDLVRPSGVALRGMASELGIFERTGKAWDALSGALGLTTDGAIEKLLGGSTVLLADGLGTGNFEWALVLTVDESTGRLVTRKLKAAPRASIQGQTVYSVDGGLVRVAHIRTSRDRAQDDEGAVLVVATPGGGGLIDAAFDIGKARLSVSRAPVDRQSVDASGTDPGAVIVYRPPNGGSIWGRLRTVSEGWRVEFEGSGLRAGLVKPQSGTGDPMVTPASVSIDAVPALPADFDAIASRSLLAYSGPATNPGSPSGVLGALAPERLVWMLLPFEPPQAFGEGEASTALLSIADAGGGKLDCSMWFGIDRITQAASIGDAYVCRVLGELTDQYGPGKNAPECTGHKPTATRSVPVFLDPARSSFGPALSFAWGPACSDSPAACGWWGFRVAAIDGLQGSARPPAYPALGSGERQHTEVHDVMVQLRPAGLASLLAGPGQPGAAPLLAPLRWVDTIRWHADRTSVDSAGVQSVSGELTVLMSPTP